jgi:hypothetical protein
MNKIKKGQKVEEGALVRRRKKVEEKEEERKVV